MNIYIINEECNFFTDLFESIADYEKIVLIMFLIKNDVNFYTNVDFQKVILTFYIKNLKIFYLN